MTEKDITSKRPQKKSKSQWRKNIDISVVDENLQTLRNEERVLGKIDGKTDHELFFVDKKGDEQVQRHIKKLRIEEILIPKSKINVPRTRQGPAAKASKTSSLDPAVKKILSAHKKTPSPAPETAVSTTTTPTATLELWQSTATASAQRSRKKTPPSLLHPASKLKALDPAHSGSSYNPSFEEHQAALAIAVKREERREASKSAPVSFSNTLSAASTLLESDNRDTSEPETRVETVVESSPTPDHDQDQDQDQKSKPSKPKTRAQRNKAMRVNEALTALKREKAIKRQLNQIDQLRSIQKEIKTAREQQQQKDLKRSLKNAHKEAYQTK